MNVRYRGSCICGQVQFSWTGTPRFVAECVCESCRRAHGASVVGWLGGPAAQFSLDQGEPLLKWFQSSPEAERAFCTACGTRIFFRSSKWAGEIHLALACMHEPHDLIATGISFKEELPRWSFLSANHLGRTEQVTTSS
ncbi:MAG: GFA family protein [Pseudomonadota bacterium]